MDRPDLSRSSEMVRACAVKGCSNYRNRPSNFNSEKIVSFHRFPLKKRNLLKQWVAATGRLEWTATRSHSICSNHFMENDFTISDNKSKKHYLLPYAVPTLNLGHVIGKPLVLDISSDDSSSNDESHSFDDQPEQLSTDAHNNDQEKSLSQNIWGSPSVIPRITTARLFPTLRPSIQVYNNFTHECQTGSSSLASVAKIGECETGPIVEVVTDSFLVEELNWSKPPVDEDVPSIEHSEDTISCDPTTKIDERRPSTGSLDIIRLKRKLETQMYRNKLMRNKYKAVQSINIRQKRKICDLEEKILCLKKALSTDNQNLLLD